MATSQIKHPLSARSQPAQLHVRRQDINFRSVSPGIVQITVTVHNIGDRPSQPTAITLQSAPFGAFLPWNHLGALRVPSIAPGRSIEVSMEATVEKARPLGDFARVPPGRLLTAIGASEEEPKPENAGNPLARLLGKVLPGKLQPQLPVNLFELIRRAGVHWAGNINVFIGGHPVERHLARALRIYPGKVNLAMFFVGRKPDEYRLTLAGSGAKWDACMYDATSCRSLMLPHSSTHQIPMNEWVSFDARRLLLLAVAPPEDCKSGCVEVRVCQRSTDHTAVVEFDLDAAAQGAGCYAV